LRKRQNKPLFLALHLCLSHWPFTWAKSEQASSLRMDQRYQKSVEEVDKQLGELWQILKENGLLANSIVILFSDHGTSFGLPGDRLLTKEQYRGPAARLTWVTVNKLSTAPLLGSNYSLNTAYGQGTEVLSLKQYRIVLALQYFHSKKGKELPRFRPQTLRFPSALFDLAPTILDLLHKAPLQASDGLSLLPYFSKGKKEPAARPLYLETGYSLSEIETNQIEVEKVLNRSIQLYQVKPENGYLFLKPEAEPAVLRNKQRAILFGPWRVARDPAVPRMQFKGSGSRLSLRTEVQAPYYLLANIKTGEWTLGLDTPFAQSAPVKDLLRQFTDFYGEEAIL
ncbi:MAG TPA: sulfatase-like hydrolase/transferase, partial [Gammaproteobacteria bacterium]|nr:sulfatase-like hydrolase/transferase [Gammaproteobacteria bacterium]